jgi:hypothetical protein
MSNLGLSDQVRAKAQAKYVHPAIFAGKKRFSIPVKALLEDLQTDGFPARNTPQVCTALQASKFLRENGLEIEGVDGPPSKLSTTVVVRYRVTDHGLDSGKNVTTLGDKQVDSAEESPEEWAFRLTEQMRGLLKEELAEYGGGEAFIRWIRSEDENAE